MNIKLYKRLADMRDEATRRPPYRPVYMHALTIAHLNGHLIADDHPSWDRIDAAIESARSGDPNALDDIEREFVRLRE